MCGRFALSKSDRIDWSQFGVKRGPQLPPHWNLGPGRPITAVRTAASGESEVVALKWGLIPSWAKDPTIGARLANARGESVHEKPSFRGAFKARRCLVPADGFYEWQTVPGAKKKQPWFFEQTDGAPFAFGGIWERWSPPDGSAPVETLALITLEANALMAPVHDRMPLIIAPSDYAAWIGAGDAQGLVAPWAAERMRCYRVSTLVNAVGNDTPECIAPLDSEE